MLATPDMRISVMLIPLWLLLLRAGYILKWRRMARIAITNGTNGTQADTTADRIAN
jgi:hypothetical protein